MSLPGVLNHEYKHGHATKGNFSPEYQSWSSMVQRCTNPNREYWEHYGGRGITVCDAWLADFQVFLRDMGPRPSLEYSLDRIDVDKGYYKENCRWATRQEQTANRRPGKWVKVSADLLSFITTSPHTVDSLHVALKNTGVSVHIETVRELMRAHMRDNKVCYKEVQDGRRKYKVFTARLST